MVKKVETYKKITANLTTALMGAATLFTIITLAYNLYTLSQHKFYVTRTKLTVTIEKDYETVTTKVVNYFLYRNMTADAEDNTSPSTTFIVDNPTTLCPSGFQLWTDKERIIAIRDNIFSPYMVISDIYIFALMFATAIITCIWIPFFMKDHHIPIFLRHSNSNVFFDVMMIRIFCFTFFITLSGSLPQLTFYKVSEACLHTADDVGFNINWTDYYQFCLTSLIWVISVPMIIFLVFTVCRDLLRFALIPVLVANLIFQIMTTILAFIVVSVGLRFGQNGTIRAMHAVNVSVFLLTILLTLIYNRLYAKKDLLR